MSKIHRTVLAALVLVVLAARLSPPLTAAGGRHGKEAKEATAGTSDQGSKPESASPADSAAPESAGEPARGTPLKGVPSKVLGGRPISLEAARLTEEGLTQMRQRHFKEAIDAFKKASSADSKHPVVWNNLGSAYLAVGNPLKAKGAFSEAVSLDRNYAMAHYNLGAVLDQELNYDGAVESYARALELDPELGSAEKNPAIVNNTHLAAIHLVLYKRQLGALGTGITPVADASAAESAKEP